MIAPLLRQIRPTGKSGTVLKWEGILIDPVGAVLAVLIFEAILEGEFNQAPSVIALGVLQTLVIVLVVVMVFLGIRTGLIVGSFVPMTMLLSVVIMRTLDIERQLHGP